MARTTTAGSQTPSQGLMWLTLIGLVAGFHAMGRIDEMVVDWSNPVRWLTVASPEVALAATGRAIGLAVSYWALATATFYFLAGRRGRIPSWLHQITLPPLRRLIDKALTTGLAASIAFAPTLPAAPVAEDPPAIEFEIHDGVPVPNIAVAPVVAADPKLAPAPPTVSIPSRARISESPGDAEVVAAETYAVVAGDNLWAIAALHLETVLTREPTNGELIVYWRSVVAANQPNLRSRDPNLIFPGEMLTLPPVPVDR